jgi:hypothetical protein
VVERQVIWWNVQRLLKPGGGSLGRALDATVKDGWTMATYQEKVARLGALLAKVAAGQQPVIVAMAEVEDAVAARSVAAAAGWPHLKTVDDPAALLAGDDLVILFDPAVLTVAEPPTSYNVHNRYTTRDLFEVTFATPAGHRFVVITNHWPSRRISNSEPLRIGVADYCRRVVERRLKYSKNELLSKRGEARMPSRAALLRRAETAVIVMGDVNDEPFDTSVRVGLDATRELARVSGSMRLPRGRGRAAVDQYLSLKTPLFNPSWPRLLGTQPAPGSTYWNGDWYLLDQLIVSRGALGGGPVRLVDGSTSLHLVREVSVDGRAVKAATRGGIPLAFDAKAGTGVSDHLPLSFQLAFE